MSWGKSGDEAPSFPELLEVALLDDAEDWSVNEVAGFVWRCSGEAARHDRDYFVSRGTALAIAGSRDRYRVLVGQCLATGLLTESIDDETGKPGFLLIRNPNFIHLLTRADKEANAQRRKDNGNRYLTTAARFRDGDQCRYCGIVTTPGDRNSPLGLTYDSRTFHRGEQEISDLVVACRRCNGLRGDKDNADDFLPLLPAPDVPFYSPASVAFLAKGNRFVTASDQRPGSQPDNAARPATGTAPGSAPARRRDARPVDSAPSGTPTKSDDSLQSSAEIRSTESGVTGSGRVGTGGVGLVRAGPGGVGSGRAGQGRGAARRRGKRRRSPRGDT